MTTIFVIHENAEWLPPFAAAFDRLGLSWSDWHLHEGVFNLSARPPEGVFYSRMSASAHTRGHRHAPELTAAVIAWLEGHGRRVLNGSRALALEISKAAQYAALGRAGLAVPRTVLAGGGDPAALAEAARRHFASGPVILKPNRGGKGLGVQLFASAAALEDHLRGLAPGAAPVDGLWLLQEHIRAPRPVIHRAEFVGGRFLYAVEVDTSGGFELCPADACAVGDAACPAGPAPAAKFTIAEGITPALRERLETFLADNGIDVAGVEIIHDAAGRPFVYDVNTNTNYAPQAEAAAGRANTARSGPGALAELLAAELARRYPAAA
jgi:glutathione synthase/RimK-type ligase-like ATP-grasp enzyme